MWSTFASVGLWEEDMFAQHCQTGVEFTLCCEKSGEVVARVQTRARLTRGAGTGVLPLIRVCERGTRCMSRA
jgi:hypothetical protein